ncbi:MAG: 5'/3'-nucleotidase SurE, partial [Meiothermus ruber]
ARQSVRRYEGRIVPGTDPMGRAHFWFVAHPDHEPEEGTDRWAVGHNFIALTPLRLDLTDEARLSQAFQLAALAD